MALDKVNGQFVIDPSHSFVNFSIKHWMSRARGTMGVDSGSISMPGNLENASVFIVLDASSINTSNSDRDETMRKPEWFNTAEHPKATFASTSVEKAEGEFQYKAKGNLTLKGVTKPAEMWFNYLGEITTPQNAKVYSFEGSTKINRTEFGIGGPNLPFLGDVATIDYSIEAN